MNELTLGTQGDRRGFLPGQEVAGGAAWRLDGIPREVEVCLFWFTRGKGTEDVVVVDTVRLDSPSREDRRDFRFTLPEGPYSFSGRLISLTWALELVTRRPGAANRVEITVSPTGEEISLGAADGEEA